MFFCFYLQMLYLRREEDPRLWPDRIESALQTALKLAQMCKKNPATFALTRSERGKAQTAHTKTLQPKKKNSAVSKLTWNWNKINPDHWIRT